jgi:putative RecB family exonuclease
MTLQIIEKQKPEEAAQLHFSYSQLSTYLLCPMKFAHRYVWGTPFESKPAAQIFGKAIHRAAETYYRNLKETGEIAPADQLVAVFRSEFDTEISQTEVEITLKSGESLESLKDQGAKLLQLFREEVSPQKIVAVEFPFSVPIPEVDGQGNLSPNLVGYFDLLETDPDGSYVVVELKTSGQRFSSLRLEYDLQATVYSYAMTRMKVATSGNSTLVRYDVLLKTKKPAFERYFVTRTEADHNRVIHLINQVLKAIENRIFYRLTGWQCKDCQFRKACFS